MVGGNPWLTTADTTVPPRARLFCIPFAGGSPVVFRSWQEHFPADIQVCALNFPGRGNRMTEPSLRRMDTLVAQAADAMAPLLDVPFAILGHSLGALIGYELAVHLREKGHGDPFLLVASAARGPQLPDPYPPLHHLPRDQFIEGMQDRYGGIPREILNEPDLLALLIPPLQADLELFETYRYTPRPPFSCPVAVFGGNEDHRLDDLQYRAWQEVTTGPLTVTMVPGGHFFIQEQGSRVAAAVAAVCRDTLPPA